MWWETNVGPLFGQLALGPTVEIRRQSRPVGLSPCQTHLDKDFSSPSLIEGRPVSPIHPLVSLIHYMNLQSHGSIAYFIKKKKIHNHIANLIEK